MITNILIFRPVLLHYCNCREDLMYWMQENMSDLRLGAPETVEKHAEIRSMVNSVKAQQTQILDRLHHEQMCLEQELKIGMLFCKKIILTICNAKYFCLVCVSA